MIPVTYTLPLASKLKSYAPLLLPGPPSGIGSSAPAARYEAHIKSPSVSNLDTMASWLPSSLTMV